MLESYPISTLESLNIQRFDDDKYLLQINFKDCTVKAKCKSEILEFRQTSRQNLIEQFGLSESEPVEVKEMELLIKFVLTKFNDITDEVLIITKNSVVEEDKKEE
jgi:hypothetical protein